MSKLLGSVAFRLALGYGVLVVATLTVISAVLYFGTVVVIDRGIDAKLSRLSEQLIDRYERGDHERLKRRIEQLLTDGIDQETEVFALLDANGRNIVGNVRSLARGTPLDRLTDQTIIRDGRPSTSRLLPHRLPSGDVLVVGRDLHDVREMEQLVVRALLMGGVVALLLAVAGAALVRRQLEHRMAAIRHTALEIEAGDLSRRIPVPDADDEFTRLNRDINRMLDRIQRLMEGVRDVSNAIAHDLRTPLGRIRNRLDEMLRPGATSEQLRDAAATSIHGIDDLIVILDKLLQIAEAEAATRRQCFQRVTLKDIIQDVVELYDATAEANGVTLTVDVVGEPSALGDKDLLASATANLVDNALKYGGRAETTVRVGAREDRESVSILVRDEGPGIPVEERAKVVTRFYRLDRSRSLPGNGLGLAIVTAISHLHGGTLSLEDAGPGLVARIVLPRAAA
jgi:signal transduction histidine kinase